jgi:hypothetical protein
MCPKEFGKGADMLADARREHEALLGNLMRCPGDSEGARRRAESLFGLPYWLQWNLRFKRRATETFMRTVREAYLSALEKSVRHDLQELEITEAKGEADAVDASLMAEAEALLAIRRPFDD